jgi:hypothetical protein
MSTLGSLMALLGDPGIKPYAEQELTANRIQSGNLTNQTSLLQLEELRRQQEAAALARQYYQANPQDLLAGGGGPQSLLGSLDLTAGGGGPMTQQQVLPGQPPGVPQPVPGGQDLSRFATGGMPGSPPQSTLGSLAPQPQQHPLMDLMRSNPDAAFAVMQRSQQMQEQRDKWQETRLTIGTRVAEFLARGAQGVTDQARLDTFRQQVQQFAPQWAAALPQYYSKEAMVPIIQAGISAKDSAGLRLETWRAKNEETRLNMQLAQAGYQGLGTAVTDVLRGLTDEQVQQFGGRTSPAAVQYATQEVQRKELERRTAEQKEKFTQEQQQQATLPLQDARKEDAGLFVYKGTGQAVPGTLPYGQVKQLQDEQDPTKGVVRLANLDEKKQLTTLKQLEPVMQQYSDLVQYAYGTDPKTGKKGPLADYQRGPFQTIGAMWNQLSQDDPVFQAKRRALQGQLQSVVRGLGARGDLNAQELEAATQMLANMDASLGLGLSLGPMVGTGGIGVGGRIQPSISLPDTPETGINIANELIGTVNRRIGSILQHEGYQKTPYIRIRTDQETEPKPGEMPRATPPPKPGPEPMPEAGPPLFPRPQIRLPGEGPAPALPEVPATRPGTPPPPPTARSTPEEAQRYRDYQQRQQTVPGRQSAAERPGWPKIANLADVAEAVRQTGRSRREVEAAMRAKGYTVYGSKLPLPGETMMG